MEEIVFKAVSRQVSGKQVKALRRQGLLPAVVYGLTEKPLLISLNQHDVSRVLPRVSSSHLVVVDLNGEQHTTLVRERQRHPLTGMLLHLDFQEVSMTEKLRTAVFIELVGESPAVKNLDGLIVTGQEKLEVECLPRDLPERIVVDISKLTTIGSAIYVRDIPVPAGVEVLTDSNEMVVLITSQGADTEAEAGAAVEPEVIERGKKEEEA
jgi:large subunit ribosomal protein L25